jgi:DNA polymerase elongation subunit (family B)
MKFYTNFYIKGDTVYIRGYNNGKRIVDRIEYSPTLYVPSQDSRSSWKTIHGESCEPIECGTIKEARNFISRYSDVDNFKIYGSNLFAYTCVNDHYGNDFDPDVIKIANIDIEVASEDGFPEPKDANQPVTAITVGVKGKYFVFGVDEYNNTRDDVRYVDCGSERRLLAIFLDFWEKIDADIVTGWNVDGFDIPYLINRIDKILGQTETKRLSPAKWIQTNTYKGKFGKEVTEYSLVGISVLDYLQLYKKFTYTQQESYRLDHIATVELNEKKIDYSEMETLHQLYKLDYQKFIDYNIKDVELVDKLEDKMRLIEQAMTIAYDAKVNFNDVFTQVRLWDVLIHNYLLERNIVVSPKDTQNKDTKFVGAYVKDPQIGIHNWVMSFDLNSLYPHLIMEYNLSPDTFVEGEQFPDVNIESIINRDIIIESEYCVTANGFAYDKSKRGFLPEMMQMMYDERVTYKQKMLEAQAELEKINKQLKELS